MEKIEVKQNIELAKLINYEDNRHDPKKLIHNFSSHVLTPDQESLLMKRLKFALPSKNLRYENYMVQFEHLFQDISKMFSKSHLKNIAFTSYKFYNKNDDKFDNITKEEHLAFLELIKLDNIIIQKADKGNVVVIVDTFKFQEVKFDKINEKLDYLLDE